ncbi:MAG: RNA polymerase sigma factor SigJ [Actinobacteria bacterium]|nr:RNA polymerase sigma factor SigJ [Actinomycetota bacterium]MBI3686401.1 RNA polymerase sigma factor SigJ [Actinomycetota bacterium]
MSSLNSGPRAEGPSQLDDLIETFHGERQRLSSLAYRMLGSRADAQDIVQEAWIRLQRAAAGAEPIRDVPAWLTTTVSRLALDQLRSARTRREVYVGPWLPEPIVGPHPTARQAASDPGEVAALADELSFAMMVVLERLTPAQRAAFILHDTFGFSFTDVASMLDRTPAACRQLASRARDQLSHQVRRIDADADDHRRVLDAFLRACAGGDLAALVAVLDPSVVYRSDSGGAVRSALNVVAGADRVARLVLGVLHKFGTGHEFQTSTLNGEDGLLVYREGQLVAAVAVTTVVAGDPARAAITEINALVNPDKLAAVQSQLVAVQSQLGAT